METKRKSIPMIKDNFALQGYNALSLMSETAKLRKLITKRGTLEILIPLLYYHASQIQRVQTSIEWYQQ
jgi:hypothetical protein